MSDASNFSNIFDKIGNRFILGRVGEWVYAQSVGLSQRYAVGHFAVVREPAWNRLSDYVELALPV